MATRRTRRRRRRGGEGDLASCTAAPSREQKQDGKCLCGNKGFLSGGGCKSFYTDFSSEGRKYRVVDSCPARALTNTPCPQQFSIYSLGDDGSCTAPVAISGPQNRKTVERAKAVMKRFNAAAMNPNMLSCLKDQGAPSSAPAAQSPPPQSTRSAPFAYQPEADDDQGASSRFGLAPMTKEKQKQIREQFPSGGYSGGGGRRARRTRRAKRTRRTRQRRTRQRRTRGGSRNRRGGACRSAAKRAAANEHGTCECGKGQGFGGAFKQCLQPTKDGTVLVGDEKGNERGRKIVHYRVVQNQSACLNEPPSTGPNDFTIYLIVKNNAGVEVCGGRVTNSASTAQLAGNQPGDAASALTPSDIVKIKQSAAQLMKRYSGNSDDSSFGEGTGV